MDNLDNCGSANSKQTVLIIDDSVSACEDIEIMIGDIYDTISQIS